MRRISVVLVLFFLVLLVSCQNGEQSGPPVQNVVLDLALDQKLFLSEIADSIDIIPLEQTNESDIGLVWRVIPYKDKFYMMNLRI